MQNARDHVLGLIKGGRAQARCAPAPAAPAPAAPRRPPRMPMTTTTPLNFFS